ncbi:succinate-semialdehyde dehydrogenase [NADP+] GabD [Hyaloraphidium curvatum]|nr:succinate-semialdehyde dehydrogenase [NADP+] GabD [Hyaloraphidium curvatum]
MQRVARIASPAVRFGGLRTVPLFARAMSTLKLKDPSLVKDSAYVDGKWVPAISGKTYPIINPANGQTIVTNPLMDGKDTKVAIEAAYKAFPAWAAKTAKERQVLLEKWFDLMIANSEDLAIILASECGKPLAEARGEIAYGASFIQWFAEEGKRAYGDVIPQHAPGRRLVVIKQPVGVVATLTPWNFPIAMLTRKAGAALAAGCTVVTKPAPETPLSTLAACVLAERAGIPAGVINAVTTDKPGAAAVGVEMTSNPIVKKISFTGSTPVGKLLMKQAADTVKKVSMELGGNAPFIVFDDADVDAAVAGCMVAKYRNAGQTCVCTNRIYVQAGVHDAFVKKYAEAVSKLKVGPFDMEGVSYGPLISEAGVEKVERHVKDAVEKGAKLLHGGKRSPLGFTFYEPTLLVGATKDMVIATEEVFGPVSAVFKFETEEQVIQLANNTDFGLAAYFYSRDIGRVWRVAEALEYGMVGINEGIISTEVAPFGGVKQSGVGREGSKYGLDEYLSIKYLTFGGIQERSLPKL